MKKIYFLFLFLILLRANAQGQCTLSLDRIYLDSANSSCNNLVFKYDVSGGTATAYFWDYGDGHSCTCIHPKNFYTRNDSFQVCGIIRDAMGCADTLCISTKVNCSNPCDLSEIGIYSIDTLSYTCNEIEFITITSNNAKKIKWDFGDGDSADSKYVIHTYSANKIYQVRLIVEDSIACADTAQLSILINCPETTGCDFKIQAIDSSTGMNCKTKTMTLKSNRTAFNVFWDYGDGNSAAGSKQTVYTYQDTGIFEVCAIAEDSLQCKDTLCRWVRVACPITGISDLQSAAFSIYPNPGSGLIFVRTDSPGLLTVFNSALQRVVAFELKAGLHPIHLSAYGKGYYLFKWESEEASVWKKFLLE